MGERGWSRNERGILLASALMDGPGEQIDQFARRVARGELIGEDADQRRRPCCRALHAWRCWRLRSETIRPSPPSSNTPVAGSGTPAPSACVTVRV